MASKAVSVILGLNDKFTKPLRDVQQKIRSTTADITESAKKINDLQSKMISTASIKAMQSKADKTAAKEANASYKAQIAYEKTKQKELAETVRGYKQQEAALRSNAKEAQKSKEKIVKVSAAMGKTLLLAGGAALTAGIKTGFSTGSELETLRANIQTVTKSAERASSVMKYAVNMANFSAFDNSELIEAASMLETYGLRTESYLEAIGDAAAITGRDVAEMSKAFGKAVVSGQFDALADIGITRDTLNTFAKSKGITLFSGTKIKDQQQFAETLKDFMNSRYAGGMKKQATTMSGMWSTISGMASNAMANMIGVTNDGYIKVGGAMDKIRQRVEGLMNTFQRWETDGTWDKLANGVSGVVSAVDTVVNRVSGNLADMLKTVEKIKEINDKIGETVTGTKIGEKVSGWMGSAGEWAKEKWGSLPPWARQWLEGIGEAALMGPASFLLGKSSQHYALGTSYHSGGAAIVGEHGPELATFPSGTKITSASGTRTALRSGGNTVNIYIQGAQRSDEQIAETVARRVVEALGNV